MKLFFLFLLLLPLPLMAQSDSFIKHSLDESTFKYFIDKDGDYIIDYKTSTGRKQNIVVRANTNKFQDIEVREIISIAARFKDKPVPEKLTKYLLIDNYSLKYLGNWAIHKKENINTVLFIVKLPKDSDLNYLEAAIIEAAEAADALERALEEESN